MVVKTLFIYFCSTCADSITAGVGLTIVREYGTE